MIARIGMAGPSRKKQRLTKTCCVMKFSPVSHGATSRAIWGAELFIHEDGNETEFVTLLRFDSMETVKEFAGMDESKPVIYPKAEALLTRIDERSHRYRIAISR
jgi:hypothetical protein